MPEELQSPPSGQAPAPAAQPALATQVVDDADTADLFDGKPFDAKRAKELIDKLREENKALKPTAKKAAEYEAQIKAQKEAEMSEAEKLKARLAEAETKIREQAQDQMRRDIASRFGIPMELASRLRGETEEEMKADAEKLVKVLPKPQPNPTNPGTNAATSETDAQKRARIYGGGSGVLFDPAFARNNGGGVIKPDVQ